MKIIKRCISNLATIAVFGFSINAHALDAPAELVPSGLSPGDTFFVMFVTSTFIRACANTTATPAETPGQIAATTVASLNSHGTTTAAAGTKTSGVANWQSLYIHDNGAVTNTVQASGAWGGCY